MYKHIQEKKGEKYVNLKHLADVSELTSPGSGLFGLFRVGEGKGVKEAEAFCHFGPGKEGA